MPDNFLVNLISGYRDYLDGNGQVRKDREASFEAFVYFLDRMLPSVNTKANPYHGPQRKTMGFGEVFTVNDEAFALVMVENYVEQWKLLVENKRKCEERSSIDRSKTRPGEESGDDEEDDDEGMNVRHDRFRAKYTSSNRGTCNSCGWSTEGIERFNEFASEIGKKRASETTGKDLEEYMMRYWQGKAREKRRRSYGLDQVVAHSEDDSLFVGAFEFV